MMNLPPGFDLILLQSDLMTLILGVVPLLMLFAAYKIARKLLRMG